MTVDEFVAEVIARLKLATTHSETLTDEDWKNEQTWISQLYHDGYDLGDAVRSQLLSEEFNPTIEEAVALRRASIIRKKYIGENGRALSPRPRTTDPAYELRMGIITLNGKCPHGKSPQGLESCDECCPPKKDP